MAARIATVAGSRDLEDERIRQMEARQQQQQQNTVAIFSRFSLNRTLSWKKFVNMQQLQIHIIFILNFILLTNAIFLSVLF